jgi:polysaccharide export outer membrane protein
VQPDGFVSLREIGDIHVVGESVPELTRTITKAYSGILHDPVVSVVLKDFEKPHFVVSGQVGKPGKFELRSDTTVTEAVAIAGGLTKASKHSQVLVFRRADNDMFQVLNLNLKAIQKGDPNEDIHVQTGDIIFVPQNTISKISDYIPRWGFSYPIP